MKDQNKTRFTVGMPVIVLHEDTFNKGVVTIDNYKSANTIRIVVDFESQDERTLTHSFTLDGKYSVTDIIPSLFTLPEYEALKALTDSFVDGTFGKRESVLKMPFIEVIGHYLVATEQQDNPIVSTKPFETLESGELEKPTPISGEWKETIDLLDENGQPVYFEVGQEVGCIHRQMKGKVVGIKKEFTYPVLVEFDNENKTSYTLDGRMHDTVAQTLYPIEQYNQIQLPKLKPIQVTKPKEDIIELIDNYNKKREIGSIYVSTYIETIANKEVSDKFYYLIQKCGAYSIDKCSFYKCELIPTVSKKFVLNVGFVFDGKNHDLFIHLDDVNNHGINISYKKNGEIKAEIL